MGKGQALQASLTMGAPTGDLPPLPEIPRARYTDAGLFAAEMESVFRKSWLIVGHASEYPEAGSYRQLDLPFAPVFVIRGKDGQLRAFLNACAHRAAAVVREASGQARVLSCPFHGWVYDHAGRLIGLPEEARFPGLSRADKGLEQIRCELWGGFLFVNLNPDAPPLLDALAPLASRYTEMMDAPMRLVSRETFEIDCNWKIISEAFREAYHIACVHPQTLAALLSPYDTRNELYGGGHSTVFSPYNTDFMQMVLDDVEEVRGYRTQLPDMPLMTRPAFMENLVAINIYPALVFGTLQNGFGHVNARPIDVGHTLVEVALFGMDWGEGTRPAAWNEVVSRFVATIKEDFTNLASIQRSVAASVRRGVVVSPYLERGVYQLHQEIDHSIGRERIAEALRVPVCDLL